MAVPEVETCPQRALAESVALWVLPEDSGEAGAHLGGGGRLGGADAPTFVPLAAMQAQSGEIAMGADGAQGCQAWQAPWWEASDAVPDALPRVPFGSGPPIADAQAPDAVTTLQISGISDRHTSESFRQLLDSWGLLGTYDFFVMPAEDGAQAGRCAVINFVDPIFASLCQWLFLQNLGEGTTTPAQLQGLSVNINEWMHRSAATQPVIIPTATPSKLALCCVNTMLSMMPQQNKGQHIKEQFHKTKLCKFFLKNRCALRQMCPFAHSKEELQEVPDLHKTKLCHRFIRNRSCNDANCKFAHGYRELRATSRVYKTELCRWWNSGQCSAGSLCRFAHGMEELHGGAPAAAAILEAGGAAEQLALAEEQHQSGGSRDRTPLPPWKNGLGSDLGRGYGDIGIGHLGAPAAVPAAPLAAPVAAEAGGDTGSYDECASQSDMSASDDRLVFRRQRTAPPATANPPHRLNSLPDGDGGAAIVLRVRGTFMEAVQVEGDANASAPPAAPLRRTLSDSDLHNLKKLDGEAWNWRGARSP